MSDKADRGVPIKLIATNPNAKRNYLIQEFLEAGIALQGTEVKSLRSQSPNLRDSYVDIRSRKDRLEAWLLNTHVPPYSHGNIWNHEPTRERKLLLHASETKKLFGAITQKGMTIIPTRMYFKKGIAKVELGLGKGKKKKDQREQVKARTAKREMDRAMKSGKR